MDLGALLEEPQPRVVELEVLVELLDEDRDLASGEASGGGGGHGEKAADHILGRVAPPAAVLTSRGQS